jgi:hypothetical protein
LTMQMLVGGGRLRIWPSRTKPVTWRPTPAAAAGTSGTAPAPAHGRQRNLHGTHVRPQSEVRLHVTLGSTSKLRPTDTGAACHIPATYRLFSIARAAFSSSHCSYLCAPGTQDKQTTSQHTDSHWTADEVRDNLGRELESDPALAEFLAAAPNMARAIKAVLNLDLGQLAERLVRAEISAILH